MNRIPAQLRRAVSTDDLLAAGSRRAQSRSFMSSMSIFAVATGAIDVDDVVEPGFLAAGFGARLFDRCRGCGLPSRVSSTAPRRSCRS